MFSRTSKTAPATSSERRQLRIEKRRRFWRKTRKVVFWVLAVGFVLHLSLNIYASVQLNRELAAIRQSGDPLRFAEIEPPLIPDAQNAAVVYARATKSVRLSPQEKSALSPSRRGSTPEEEKLIESAIRNNQQAIALTRQAAAMPQCRFPLDWKGDPTRFLFPYYADLRELARLLAQDAALTAKNGDGATALRDIRALFGISHHLSKEPYLIGFLVAQAINGIAHQALAQTLQEIPLTVPQARALESSLPQDDWTRAFRQSLVGERTMGIFAFESLGQPRPKEQNINEEDGGVHFPAWLAYPLVWLARPLFKLDEVQMLRLWKVMIDSPESQQVPIPVAFVNAQNTAISNAPFYASLTKILLPVFSRSSDTRDRAEVKRRQREVALALTCYRTAQGRYPDKLQEATKLWGSPLSLDPYSQKPFVYRSTSNGKSFVLYSIGVNRVDDGGKSRYSSGVRVSSSADDIQWITQ